MKEIIFASSNQNKINEMKEILGDTYSVLGLKDVFNDDVDIIEDGTTFKVNALIKARYVYQRTKKAVLSDDSGIIIDSMPNELGVYSARFMKEWSYQQKNQYIVDYVFDKDKSCRYVCCIVFIDDQGNEFVVEKTMEGLIHHTLEGDNGFGYDPIFYYPPYQMTAAMMTNEQKNACSHRGQAVKEILKIIKGEIQ